MLKMLLDPMGGIVLTNDGNAILREVEVAHPAAKSMVCTNLALTFILLYQTRLDRAVPNSGLPSWPHILPLPPITPC